MLRIADNLKHAVAIVAVLLSLSAMAQSAGIYCYFGACEAGPAASEAASGGCCHSHTCKADEEPKPREGGRSQHRHEPCPCPDSCWCQQAPQPSVLPKSIGEPVELAFLSVLAVCDDVVGDRESDLRANIAWSVPPGLSEQSAVDRCAKLCRFLI
ncbi:hypothetical protein [Botrimarina mediterranea]|uniref:Uncharacterized protein n=1 Tax=Botrimarina mediterranea TaxID=2528022 RepID=A0A518K7C1_9BACT|nr:hypothetical protein [Botrimarina mediterranea]QDV73690.1 hypothetical protein Spa11_18890 [Botrimarina mediterranea]QDV78280.1 hypothetical protein K2D_18870 [Planctomycetes bacterium K2D]